jgi:hypothetical protein
MGSGRPNSSNVLPSSPDVHPVAFPREASDDSLISVTRSRPLIGNRLLVHRRVYGLWPCVRAIPMCASPRSPDHAQPGDRMFAGLGCERGRRRTVVRSGVRKHGQLKPEKANQKPTPENRGRLSLIALDRGVLTPSAAV